MKKNLFILSAIAVTAAALVSCNKEQGGIINEETQGIPFEIIAGTVDTKTVNDGVKTTWASTDHINLFHAVHGETTYNNDGDFTAKGAGATVGFTGTLKDDSEPTSGNTYDWFALYPYESGYTTPNGSNFVTITSSMYQTGYNSTAHLTGNRSKLAGKVESVAYDATPSITMHNLASVIKLNVKNALASNPIVIKSITITAPNKITGQFNLDITGAAPALSEIDEKGETSVTLTVNDATELAANSTASFYLPIKPITAAAGSTFTVIVATNRGTDTIVSSALPSDFTFQAGKMHNMNVNYDVDTPASIPFSITGEDGKAGYVGVNGLQVFGVDSDDYAGSNTPYLAKWDTDGITLDLYCNARVGVVSFGVRKIGGADDSSILVSSSVDGIDYSDVESFNITGAKNAVVNCATTNEVPSTHRFIRLTFTKGSNIGFGPFNVAAYGVPTISASDITDVPAVGVTDATTTYSISSFAGDDDVTVTPDGTYVTAASVNHSTKTITYTVAPNYQYSAKVGTITINSEGNSCSKVINVNQLRSDLYVNDGTSGITVIIPKNESTATFTVKTKEFAWNATVNQAADKNLSASPLSGDASASNQTITITSTTVAAEDEQTLGTIVVYRNGNTSDPQKRTITVKKASTATILYSCGFESADGFTAGSTYNTTSTQGPSGSQWQVYYGTASSTAATLLTGSNSMVLRKYNDDTYWGYAEMLFDVTGGPTKVQFNAKAQTSNGASLKLTVEYSVNSGGAWTVVSGFSAKALTTSSAPYSFTVDGAPEKYRLRFSIDDSSTKPSTKNANLSIDDIKILKEE